MSNTTPNQPAETMKFVPLSDQVFIKILNPQDAEVTPGGIYIPATVWKEVNRGVVVAVGPGLVVPPAGHFEGIGEEFQLYKWDRGPMTCRVGDIVLFQPSLGVPLDGRLWGGDGEYRCIREPEIRLIISRA